LPRNKCGKKLVAGLIAAGLFLSMTATPPVDVFARTISEIQAEQNQLEAEKAQLDEQMSALQGDIDKQQEYLDTIIAQQQNLQSQIDGLNLQIDEYDAQILEIENSIADTQAEIEENTEVLKERLKAIYMMGEASTLEILLNCDSLLDFSEKTEFLQAVSEHDLELISNLKEDVDAVADDISTIETYKQTVSNNKNELDQKSKELSDLYEEGYKVMEELGMSQEELAAESYDIETQMEANADEISELQAPPISSDDSSIESSGGGYIGTGNFIWPCPGYTYLTSYWGDGRNHQGIDISEYGIYGADVVAADSGTVTWAVHSGWGGGYGLSVWIDHGNGYSTRYGHFSQTLVNVGDYVQQGQVIGRVGSTGDSSGPHLHFEIRYYDVAYDPMQWFS
jgi:murein DD-endopeptidase MepM/ murein hydrolase activator NlpD